MKRENLIVEALRKIPPSKKWFKLSKREKLAFQKARLAEKRSYEAGFILGGTIEDALKHRNRKNKEVVICR